jgi:hypothetical protein
MATRARQHDSRAENGLHSEALLAARVDCDESSSSTVVAEGPLLAIHEPPYHRSIVATNTVKHRNSACGRHEAGTQACLTAFPLNGTHVIARTPSKRYILIYSGGSTPFCSHLTF